MVVVVGRAHSGVGDGASCCFGFATGLLFSSNSLSGDPCVEGPLYCFVLQAFLFERTKTDHFVLGLLLQCDEDHLLGLDVTLAIGEFGLVGDQLLLRNVVRVERITARVGQHVDEHLGLHLILGAWMPVSNGMPDAPLETNRDTATDSTSRRKSIDHGL